MAIGRLALDLWMVGVLLSMAGIGLFFVLWAGVSVLTVTHAARRARRLPPESGELWDCFPERGLAQLDEALARIVAEERGTLPGRRRW